MTARLLKSFKAAHAGNAAIHIMKEEEILVVEPASTEWRVFFGFDGVVQFVRGDDPISEFDVNEDDDGDYGWYHQRLLTQPEEYARQLLDETGVEREYAEDEAAKKLRDRINRHAIRSVSEDDGAFDVVAAYDGVESHLSIGDVDRDEAVHVALCGLRLDYVRREIGRGTATAADVRIAIEDAAVLGHGDDDVSDLIDAFMLLASDGELDDWREEKLRRLSNEMDEAEAAHCADPRPVLADAETVEVWSTETPSVNGTAITLSRETLTSALREAAAQGMDNTSGPSSEQAASCREVADEIVEAIEAGRFSSDYYGYRAEHEESVS